MQDGHPKLAATEAIVSPPAPSRPSSPRKVLILSGEMGEGHNAAAAAITEAIAEVWPGCEVERFDTLELWGRGFSRFMSRGYEIQIRLLPATYEVFYDALCASRTFAALSKLAIGSFFGRRLKTFLTTHDADLVISVYPFGSAALHWLRTHHSYKVPTATYIPAFHVHPVWAYAGIDQHYVMYDTAPDHAECAGFERTMRIGAPPVKQGFGTVSKKEARERLGLGQDRFILLTTGGAWGLGGVDEAVQSLTSSEIERLQVIAVCGKSTRLLHHIESMGIPEERLRAFGYVDNMHEIMAASDVVVTNGAGVTVLEALRTPRPVIAFKPLAGHGKAATDEMMRRDLALEANNTDELVSVVRELATDQVLMARMEHAGREWCRGRELRDSVRGMNDLFPASADTVNA